MTDIVISIKFDACKYRVVWPDFFLECSITTAKKLLDWICKYQYLNEESYRVVDEGMPELKAMSQQLLGKALEENKAKCEMDLRHYYKYEDMQDAKRYWDNKAKHLRKMPERAEKLTAYWKERTA